MADARLAALALYKVINRMPLEDGLLEQASHYFATSETPIDPLTFRNWLNQIQEGLDQQPRLIALASEWFNTLGSSGSFTYEQAALFHHQYASALDTSILFKQAVVIGFADRHANSTFDMEISQPAKTTAWILLYTVAGTAELRAGLREARLAAGDAVLMSPNSVYTIKRSSKAPRWAHYWISFQPHTDWRAHLNWPTLAPHIGHLQTPGKQHPEFKSLLDALLQNYSQPSPLQRELDANLLEQLILRFHNMFADSHRPVVDERIAKAQQYIEAHYNQPFTLDDVARAVHISSSRLSALFKAQTGISVFQWRDERRLIQAARLLRSSDARIAQIGAAVGIPDPTYFSRSFVQHVGCSPRQYRQGRSLSLARGE